MRSWPCCGLCRHASASCGTQNGRSSHVTIALHSETPSCYPSHISLIDLNRVAKGAEERCLGIGGETTWTPLAHASTDGEEGYHLCVNMVHIADFCSSTVPDFRMS